MKLSEIIFLTFLTVSLTGCGKWLDIAPEDTTTERDLFSDYGGYRSAINGIYQTLASSELYGENLSWGFLSALSQYYDNASAGNNMKFSYTEQYDYASDEVKEFGEEIWSQGYFVIANCNNVLQHIAEADPSMFPYYEEGEMDLIKAEAMAVRALVHFDLLRLFAEAPAVNMDGMAIPYSKTYPDMFPQRLTTRQVLDNVIADFNDAAALLEPFDMEHDVNFSSIGNKYNASNSISETQYGLFFSARGFRLNYIAVRSLLARVYAYADDMDNAYNIASDIISRFVEPEADTEYDRFAGTFYEYTPRNQFSDTDTEEGRPHKLADGVVSALYSATLVNDFSVLQGADIPRESNYYKLKNLDNIFNDVDDIRRVKLISGQSYYVSIKYSQRNPDSEYGYENCMIPVMRLSELNLLRAEYMVSQGNIEDAVSVLNELRQARGCMQRTLDASSITVDALNAEIEKEVWRENIGEGQYFFFCKRKNLPTINNNGVHIQMSGKYTMQIPDSQTNVN